MEVPCGFPPALISPCVRVRLGRALRLCVCEGVRCVGGVRHARGVLWRWVAVRCGAVLARRALSALGGALGARVACTARRSARKKTI